MRGPGEMQLETDRRLLNQRIGQLGRRLDKVRRQRRQGRRARRRGEVPLVALVGYTNAGKSTLFNRLTASEVMARDQLFATLDPTVRRIEGLPGSPVLLSDTVGFIRELPHELVAAFRSTLEETLKTEERRVGKECRSRWARENNRNRKLRLTEVERYEHDKR